MSHSLLIAFVLFATVMFFTPGPNNIMLLSSGLTYGFRPTIPHIAGITFGFAFMVGAVGLGLGTIFITFPVLQTILKYAGVVYLIYLAATIALSGPVMTSRSRFGRDVRTQRRSGPTSNGSPRSSRPRTHSATTSTSGHGCRRNTCSSTARAN